MFKIQLSLSIVHFRLALLLFASLLGHSYVYAQPIERHIKTPEYRKLQEELSQGWNTWYNNSLITEALLPDGFAINLCFARANSSDLLKDVLPAAAIQKRPENVVLGLRADDGYYTSLQLTYKSEEFEIETATQGGEEYVLITPSKPASAYLVAEPGILWNLPGSVGVDGGHLFGKMNQKEVDVFFTATPLVNGYTASTAPHLALPLNQQLGISTGHRSTLEQISNIIKQHRSDLQNRVKSYGDLSESFEAMQTVLAWNTIYDAPNHRVITPVSRLWNYRWGAGYVLFNWDTYFASYMLALFNKNLAYANAVEITKSITSEGFVPNFQSNGRGVSTDRSQPPVGSTIILHIYKQYGDKWFLKEVYDELYTWNKWWPAHRAIQGYISWGSYDEKKRQSSLTYAKYESGLDNSPMYDGIPLDSSTHTLMLADVGLLSLYISDCRSLAAIATELGKANDATELNTKADHYQQMLVGLWNEQTSFYYNKRLDNNEFSLRISPTNFYPLLAHVPTNEQAKRMMSLHFNNPDEFYGKYMLPSVPHNDPAFNDNNYWRGRVWGPLNFLTYLGMRNYDMAAERNELIEKSKSLFLQNWRGDHNVFENYNSVTGSGGDVINADGSYHWGALLVFMEFIEKGLIK